MSMPPVTHRHPDVTNVSAAGPPGLQGALARILEAEDFPALSRRMGELLGGSDTEEASAQRVATLILRDYGLTLKIVRAANSVHYNRGRRPVRSVTQAMMLLGLQRVRELAMSLALFDHYGRRSEQLRELLLLSILTASHARETAMRVGLADPEAVQVCGMCHNLGEVLVAAHFPTEYAQVGRLAETLRRRAGHEHDIAPAGVVRAVLGFSYEELGEELLVHWGMPDEVRRTLRATGAPGESLVEQVTAFSHALSSAVYRIEAGREVAAAGEGAAAVFARFAEQLGLSREGARAVIGAAAAEAREVFQDAGLPLDATPLALRCTAALADLGDEEAAARLAVLLAPSAFAPPHEAGTAPATTRHATPLFVPAIVVRGADGTLKPNAHVPALDPTAVQRLRERLLADIEAAIPPETGGSLHDVMLTVLEALLRGGPADRALLCLTNRERTLVEARFGLGQGAESLGAALRVPLDGSCAPMERAIHRQETVIVADGRGTPLAEARWVRSLGVQRVVLLPLVVQEVTIGCLYADVKEDVPVTAATREFGAAVRAAAARAIAARRETTPTSAPAVPERTPLPDLPDDASPPPEPARSPEMALERRDVVLRLLRGASPQSLSAELGVPVEVLAQWHRAFLEGALSGLQGGGAAG